MDTANRVCYYSKEAKKKKSPKIGRNMPYFSNSLHREHGGAKGGGWGGGGGGNHSDQLCNITWFDKNAENTTSIVSGTCLTWPSQTPSSCTRIGNNHDTEKR